MAIQEVEKKEAEGTAGLTRKINKAAEGMILDIVQAQQYTKPIPSTVRELTANAVDAQSEKEKAIEILTGKAEPDKYFIRRDGELYKDSNWDSSYYSLEHFNTEKNEIELIYKEREGVGRCDSFIVRDHGTGIGKRRLEGLFEVGYSTKRNRKDALGAFGLGAKVGLSTGADYYKLTTVYNGVKYMFQVFNRKVNSLIGALNMETGKENIPRTFSNGEKEITIYGEATTEKNYTEVEVPTMRHHKEEYIVAVKTQLLYFPNVRFHVEYQNGSTSEVHFKAKTLYNSENLIISDTSPYSKPHVIIVKGGTGDGQSVGVCYGHIEFKELELQDLNGNVGIKCPIRSVYEDDETGEEIVIQEGVDVIPSREAIRWTPATREYLKKQFGAAQDEATNLIEKELSDTDFLRWLEACRNITSYSGQNTALGRLSKIVDFNSIKPKFSGDKRIIYDHVSSLFRGFKLKTYGKYLDQKTKKYELTSEEVISWPSVHLHALYLRRGASSRKTSLYIADQSGGSFTSIKPKTDEQIQKEVQELVSTNKLKFADRDKYVDNIISIRDHIITLLETSYRPLNYDNVVVPDDYWKNLQELEHKAEHGEENKPVVITPEQRRKLEERVVANTYSRRHFAYYTVDGQSYKREKVEPKIKEIQDYPGKLYFGSVVDEPKLQLALHIIDQQMQRFTGKTHTKDLFYNDHYRFLLVGKENRSYFKNHSPIDDFFGKVVDHVEVSTEEAKITGVDIMIDQGLVKWNTARKLDKMLQGLDFFKNFSTFDSTRALRYKELVAYRNRYYSDLSSFAGREGMNFMSNTKLFLDGLEVLQNFIQEGKSAEEIAEKVKDLAMPEGVTIPENTVSCLVVESNLIAQAEDLLTYAGPVKALFNNIPLLTETEGIEIPIETSLIIGEILQFKGLCA